MLYTRIKNTRFIASNRYDSILNISYQPTFIFTKIPKQKSFAKKKVPKTNFMDFSQIHKIAELHTEYLKSLKSNATPDNFLPILYKAELTGATIEIENYGAGVVLEERENVLRVYTKGKIKTFVKNNINFPISLDNVKYIFCGKNLKKNRFIKK